MFELRKVTAYAGLLVLLLGAACAPSAPPAAPTAAPAKPTAPPAPTQAAPAAPTSAPTSAPAAAPKPTVAPTAAPAAAAKPTGPAKKLRVGISGAFLPLASTYVADHLGYFKDENLDVEIRTTPGLTGAQALLSGDLDLFASAATDTMLLAGRGERMIGVSSPELNAIVSLSVRPESLDKRNVKPSDPLEKRLAAIKGMTIAVSGEGSVTDTALQLMIKQANLARTDVTKVNIDAHPARLAAMQAGQIDGFVAGAPLDVVTERSKDALIFIDAKEIAEMKDFVFETYYGTASWVDAHPDEIRAFNRAIVKANKYLKDSPDAPKLLVDNEFKSVDLSALTESLNRMKPGIPADGKMTQAGWNGVMRFSVAGGLIPKEIDVSEGTYWTNKYLE